MSMLAPLADITALAVHLGVSIADDDPRAVSALSIGSTLVRARAGRNYLDAQGNLLADIPDGIRQATVLVASRVYTNPTQANSDASGPFRKEWSDKIELTDAEGEIVDAAVNPGGLRGLGTISTTRGDLETRPVCDDYGPGAGSTEAELPWELMT